MIFTLKMLNLSAYQFFLRHIFGSRKLQGGFKPAKPPLATPLLQDGRLLYFYALNVMRKRSIDQFIDILSSSIT